MMGNMRFPELTYANPEDPIFKRKLIQLIEKASGRDYFADLYETWRSQVVGHSDQIMTEMLRLININLVVKTGNWPISNLPDTPLMLVANHPFGIGDGIASLALAEKLGRPYKVLINNELLKVPEIRPYSLPVNFEENRQALEMNLHTKREAVRLLKEGTTIVVFPAGGVATAPKGFGAAQDLPWKMFPARLVHSARASVLPVYFEGQNSWIFQLASRYSMNLRTSLFIREFRKLCGSTITAHVGKIIDAEHLASFRDRKVLTEYLQQSVLSLGQSANG